MVNYVSIRAKVKMFRPRTGSDSSIEPYFARNRRFNPRPRTGSDMP